MLLQKTVHETWELKLLQEVYEKPSNKVKNSNKQQKQTYTHRRDYVLSLSVNLRKDELTISHGVLLHSVIRP